MMNLSYSSLNFLELKKNEIQLPVNVNCQFKVVCKIMPISLSCVIISNRLFRQRSKLLSSICSCKHGLDGQRIRVSKRCYKVVTFISFTISKLSTLHAYREVEQ